jgi:hypothetical protein
MHDASLKNAGAGCGTGGTGDGSGAGQAREAPGQARVRGWAERPAQQRLVEVSVT